MLSQHNIITSIPSLLKLWIWVKRTETFIWTNFYIYRVEFNFKLFFFFFWFEHFFLGIFWIYIFSLSGMPFNKKDCTANIGLLWMWAYNRIEQNRTFRRRWAGATSIGQLDGNSTRLAGERSEHWCSMTLGHVVETEIRLTHPPLTSSYILYIRYTQYLRWKVFNDLARCCFCPPWVTSKLALGRNSSDYELTSIIRWYLLFSEWLDWASCWPSLFRFWLIFAIMLSLKQTPSFVKLSRLTWNVTNYSCKKC